MPHKLEGYRSSVAKPEHGGCSGSSQFLDKLARGQLLGWRQGRQFHCTLRPGNPKKLTLQLNRNYSAEARNGFEIGSFAPRQSAYSSKDRASDFDSEGWGSSPPKRARIGGDR
jgi:hypothetical protein